MDFKKIICPSYNENLDGDSRKTQNYVCIKYKNGNLSITGVVAPKGHEAYSFGRCYEKICNAIPGKGWSKEMLEKLLDIWEKYHLNDMRPYCSHQKALGWNELSKKKITIVTYSLTNAAYSERHKLEGLAVEVARGKAVHEFTAEEKKILCLDYSLESAETISEDLAFYYKESKRRVDLAGWIKEEKHPEGILEKPCPVCGYRYGSAWKREDVPSDVIEWLLGLPEAKSKPKYWFN